MGGTVYQCIRINVVNIKNQIYTSNTVISTVATRYKYCHNKEKKQPKSNLNQTDLNHMNEIKEFTRINQGRGIRILEISFLTFKENSGNSMTQYAFVPV